jgi:endonuclease VIII
LPEGDTIWRTANALRPRLTGKRLTQASPERFSRLTGATVTAVEANGKHLLIRFDSGLVLHSHMRMTGAWHLYRPGEAWRKPQRMAKVVLGNEDTVAVLFNILAPELDLAEVLRRARASNRQALGELLLDQRVAAGIGNIYKCESLHRLRLNPWQPAIELSDEELSKLYREARSLMQAALHGRWPHAVHGRAGRSCPRCSDRIRCLNQGDPARFTYFCPTCQAVGLR